MTFERDSDLVEKLVERQVVHDSNYLTFARDTIAAPDGSKHSREIVLHPGAVTVVALLPDGRVVLVRQYRHAAGEVLLELPAGTLDRQPDGSIEDPLLAGERELMEETGYRAASWRKLSTFWTAPGFATELMHLYLATDLSADPAWDGPEPDERLIQTLMPLGELVAMAERGEIRDAKTIIGIYMTVELARAGKVAELAGYRDATAS
ncbi:MAG TPA: NUDIX hydrolase [Candidatus Limnocylindrales bacterium]|nr:NUDIX hydrolase [Candidatus Limnocylindrales bacterium]